MAYRRSQYPPGGIWGPFLDALRQQRGWTAVEAGKQLLPVLGLSATSTALYKAIEWGQRRLSDTEDAALRKHLGSGPDLNPPAAVDPPKDPMLAVAERQAKAIEDLVLRIDRLLESRDKELVALASLLGKAYRGRAIPDRRPTA
jgi:hypothetical protein